MYKTQDASNSTRDVVLAQLIILYISCIKQKQIVNNDLIECVCTFIMFYFRSKFDNSLSGVSKIIINNELCVRVI